MIDLRDQKIIRDKRQMRKHLRNFDLDPSYSNGVWHSCSAEGQLDEPYVKGKPIKEVPKNRDIL